MYTLDSFKLITKIKSCFLEESIEPASSVNPFPESPRHPPQVQSSGLETYALNFNTLALQDKIDPSYWPGRGNQATL